MYEYRSYGIICYCQETKKWLTVCSRHSYSYLLMLGAKLSYDDTRSEVPRITRSERQKLLHLCDNVSEYGKYFLDAFCDVMEDTESYYNFVKDSPRLKADLEKLNPSLLTEDSFWGWPKGRKEAKETEMECAFREFREETGINPPKNLIKLVTKIERKVRNKIYYSEFWLGVIPDHINLPEIKYNREIGIRSWMDSKEVRERLDPSYVPVFEEAKKVLSKMLLTDSE